MMLDRGIATLYMLREWFCKSKKKSLDQLQEKGCAGRMESRAAGSSVDSGT